MPIHLSHEKLYQMLLEHDTYNSSEGKNGELLNLSGYIIENFDFSGRDLSEINARMSIFLECKFICCDLYHSYFNNSSLIKADFRNSTLSKAELNEIDATDACFDSAKISSAEFMDSNLRQATFRHADLYDAIISDCDLTNTIFDDADVTGAAISDNQEDNTSWKNVKGRNIKP